MQLEKTPCLQTVLTLALITILGFCLYSNTLQAPFTIDDVPNIVENPHIRMTRISPDQIAQIKNSRSPRPFANFSFALNYYFHQYQPGGYHLVNILVHIINALLVFLVAGQSLRLCRVKSVFPTSLSAALLWLVHPLHTQSVTYVVQRMNSMAALFYLLALFCYVEARRIPRGNNHALLKKSLLFTAVGLSGVLGLGSKQTIATLPIMLFFYEWFFFQDIRTAWLKKNIKRIGLPLIIVLTIAILYLGAHPLGTIQSLYDTQQFTLSQRVLTEPSVIIYYISLLIFPHPSRLNLDYDFPLSTGLLSPPETAFGLLAIFALLTTAIYLARKYRLAAFAILWFLITLSIESSFIGLALIFEHRTYLPSVFPVIACVSLLLHGVKPKPAVWGLLTIAIGLGIFWTWQRNATWENAITLWQDCSSKSPQKDRPYNNLGLACKEAGRTGMAVDAFRQCLALNPRYGEALNNMGLILQENGDLEGALEFFKKAGDTGMAYLDKTKHLLPTYYLDALYNSGVVLFDMGQWEKAFQFYQKILDIDPLNEKAHNHIGIIHLKQGKSEEALASFQHALETNPHFAEAYNNMGIVYFHDGKADKAVDCFQKSIAASPDYTDARNNLDSIRGKIAQYGPTLQMFIQARDTNPANPDIHYQLGQLYQTIGMVDAAIDQYQKALQLKPDWKLCLNTLGNLCAFLQRDEKAIAAFENMSTLLPDQPNIFYNLACLYARRNNKEQAVANLKLAIANGYDNQDKIKTDPDLAKIRDTLYYRQLITGQDASDQIRQNKVSP